MLPKRIPSITLLILALIVYCTYQHFSPPAKTPPSSTQQSKPSQAAPPPPVNCNDIKQQLCEFAHQQGFRVATEKCKGSDEGEWLFDMVWWKQDQRFMTRVPLVLESELNASNNIVDDDFIKLLLAKAEHRIWIFERKTRQQVKESFKECIENIKQFGHSQKGDRYLMFGVDWNPRDFQYRLYVHQ